MMVCNVHHNDRTFSFKHAFILESRKQCKDKVLVLGQSAPASRGQEPRLVG